MSFGCSVGHFIALGTLAWKVYKSCKGAPEAFKDISLEVLSLHAVLKEAEETVFAQALSPERQQRLKAVGDGCYQVLTDLDKLCKKYQSLGAQSKRTWDRMRWGSEDVVVLRARLISNTGLLTAWIRYLFACAPNESHADSHSPSMSQATVHKKLDDFLQEFREGKREGSVISTRTTDSIRMNDKQVWNTIGKELEDIGITVAAFNANKDFIFEWFSNAIRSGAFEERSLDDSPAADPYEDASNEVLGGSQWFGSFTAVAKNASREQLSPNAQQSEAPAQPAAASKPHVPRVAALIARVSRPNKSLVTAVQKGNPSKVCEILKEQRKVVWLDGKSLSWALREVAKQGHAQAVQLLLEQGADIDAARQNEDTALVGAARNGHEQVVWLLLEKGADVEATGEYHNTALLCASQNGHERIVQLLLERGANVDFGRPYMDTALVRASLNGHEQIVRLLLEKGADINAAVEYHDTALVAASRIGHEQIVQLLLENGANTNTTGRYEDAALVCASRIGHKRIVQLLLEKGANINATGEYDDTALVSASRHGDRQIVQLLLKKGADVNAAGQHGRTALETALLDSHKEVVRLLLEYGAQPGSEWEREQVLSTVGP